MRIEYLRSMRTAISGLDRIISPNVWLLIVMRSAFSTTSASAVRGRRSKMDISPKKSPFSSTVSVVFLFRMFLQIDTLPVWMMYISSPSSPSRKTNWPLVKWLRNLAKGFSRPDMSLTP